MKKKTKLAAVSPTLPIRMAGMLLLGENFVNTKKYHVTKRVGPAPCFIRRRIPFFHSLSPLLCKRFLGQHGNTSILSVVLLPYTGGPLGGKSSSPPHCPSEVTLAYTAKPPAFDLGHQAMS